jgi:hypothetical protein
MKYLKLIDQVDVVFEGYRPGVMEKLGLGPDTCLKKKSQACLWKNDWLGSGRTNVQTCWP